MESVERPPAAAAAAAAAAAPRHVRPRFRSGECGVVGCGEVEEGCSEVWVDGLLEEVMLVLHPRPRRRMRNMASLD